MALWWRSYGAIEICLLLLLLLLLLPVYQTLVVTLVLTKLDYGNATLAGLPANLLNRFQSVINAAARSIAGLRHSEHISDTLPRFSLAWCSRVHQIQTGGPCLPNTQRHCTSVPVWTTHPMEQSAGGYHNCFITDNIPTKTENALI